MLLWKLLMFLLLSFVLATQDKSREYFMFHMPDWFHRYIGHVEDYWTCSNHTHYSNLRGACTKMWLLRAHGFVHMKAETCPHCGFGWIVREGEHKVRWFKHQDGRRERILYDKAI